MRDADGSVSWNDKMITGLSDGNRAEGESLLPGFSVAKHTTKRSGGPFLVFCAIFAASGAKNGMK